MGFLHRHPYATDAYELGFAPGIREDYSFQDTEPNVDLPTVILDNDFADPDIDRYLECFKEYNPSVAILGDAYTPVEAEGLNKTVGELQEEYPFKEYVAVPKCREAFDIFDEDVILGYAMGYSDVHADDVSPLREWRGRRVHLLGASPPKQYSTIQDLTQPNLYGDPPADIVGLDWNGPHKVAYNGEFWSRAGWQPADHLSIRETVRKSLEEIKAFWQEKGVWPALEPIDLYDEAVKEPEFEIYMDQGGDPILDREGLESAYVEEYEEKGTLAFQNESRKKFIEYREDLTPV